jgi:S-adenosylmethionine-dependent methyltransferase
MNASQLETEFGEGAFQLVLFFACLEHMTVGERLQALSQAWKILPPGGMLGVIETPNRLWFHDGHTAFLPFFHWLPDELAFQYARFSPRENFREVYQGPRAESAMHFLRRGRGVSFHEFDVAIQPVGSLAVAESLSSFQQKHHMSRPSAAHATFAEFLQQQAPTVPAPFFEEDLNLVLRKN